VDGELTFRLVFLNVCVLTYVVRRYYTVKIESICGKIPRQQRWIESLKHEGKSITTLRTVLSPIWVVALLLYFFNPAWMAWSTLPYSAWLRWFGIGLGIACIPMLVWVQRTLGNHWSTHLKLRENHTLVTTGPYKRIRHPMYVVLFFFITAIALATASLLITALNVLLIIVFYARISKEEQMMIQKFGGQYRDYMKHTGRFIPKLDPESPRKKL
jgi:protein-S-isoprenylcysteine O-methyltransferase Ste14